jgi:cyclophilin family peptidyl-prolyl cis-trans isomerase
VTRLLIPLVAAVTLVLLVVWLQQGGSSATPAPAASQAAGVAADTPVAPEDAVAANETPAQAADTETTSEDDAPTADEPGTDPVAPPDDGPVAPPDDGPVAPPGDGPVAPPGDGPVAPPGDGPVAPADDDVVADLPEGFAAVAPIVAERRVAFEEAAEVLDPDLDYAAVIETNRGTIFVELFERETPITVNNFVFLALHRYFDGIVFHRVIDGFMAQTGDPTGTGTGGPGYQFADEIVEALQHDAPGVLSMANAGPGTNGSQFFLTFDATPWLDGAHTVFGRVTEGLEVLDAITRVDPQQPSIVALLADPAASVREQGLELDGDGTVGEALSDALGVTPVPGPGYEVAGTRVIIGSVNGEAAAGFFPSPDLMERVTIVARPRD